MMLQNVFHPLLGADVGVDFGCKDAFVAEHLLHYAQVCTVFNQMGCKGVPEGVGGDFFVHSQSLHTLTDHGKDHYPSKLASSPVKEKSMIGFLGEFVHLSGRLAVLVASTVFSGS